MAHSRRKPLLPQHRLPKADRTRPIRAKIDASDPNRISKPSADTAGSAAFLRCAAARSRDRVPAGSRGDFGWTLLEMAVRFRVVTLNLEQDHKRWDERDPLVV